MTHAGLDDQVRSRAWRQLARHSAQQLPMLAAGELPVLAKKLCDAADGALSEAQTGEGRKTAIHQDVLAVLSAVAQVRVLARACARPHQAPVLTCTRVGRSQCICVMAQMLSQFTEDCLQLPIMWSAHAFGWYGPHTWL